MMARARSMADSNGLVSSTLLIAGVVLVFAGLTTALGVTIGGTVASLAAIVTLLYAGAVWFGQARSSPGRSDPAGLVIVFDRALSVVCGAGRGTPLVLQFPGTLRADIEMHCVAALAGQSSRFTCDDGVSRLDFDAAPVRFQNGSIVYGILLSAAVVDPIAAGRDGRAAGDETSAAALRL